MVENFEKKLDEYAHLLVEVGLNVQKGQRIMIYSQVECAEMARKCVTACYDAGAYDVMVEWEDDYVTRETYMRADDSRFNTFPAYRKAKADWMVENKVPRLYIIGDDPELLKGVDPERIMSWQKVAAEPMKKFREAYSSNTIEWCIGAHPTKAWAEIVFPNLKGKEAIEALWEAVFKTCRINGDGKAVERWKEHTQTVTKRANIMNKYNFKELHYTNSLGTDLHIKLPKNHIWTGAKEESKNGITFIPNMPTEEIFTAPDRLGVDGRVYSAMPLALDGNLVDGFYLDFKGGKVTGFHADKGEEYLKNAVEIDEGASFLGEVALVPFDSPIQNTGILFYNTLFDENASCHLAFGSAYPSCVKGGTEMTEEEQTKAGINHSQTHVDFMVGTKDLSIKGITQDGKEVDVFVDGNFAF